MAYDFHNLTQSQQWLLTVQGWDIHTRTIARPTRRTVQPLIDRGLVVEHRMAFQGVSVEAYVVPIDVHAAWTAFCKAEAERARRRTTPRIELKRAGFSLDVLRQSLSYDPDTGVFTRLFNLPGKTRAGDVAGTIKQPSGYICIRLQGRNYYAHRLAWFYVHGCWPANKIDHINGVRTDNRLCNLREATDHENSRNSATPVTNTSGRKGVSWSKQKGKWRAVISEDGKHKSLGEFADFAAACIAREEAEARIYGEFRRADLEPAPAERFNKRAQQQRGVHLHGAR